VPLTDRFQLFDLRRDEGARTFEAREIATGRPVLVHLFSDRTSPLNRVLLARLDALPEKEHSRVLDRGEHEGGVYVVTDRLAEYAGLREWLAQKDQRPKNQDSGTDWRKRAVKPSIDDQLAHLFDTAPLPVVEPSPLAPPPAPVLMNTGQQTLLIPKPVQPAKPPVVAAPVVPVPPAAKEPGEFTTQFVSGLQPVATEQLPAQSAAPPAEPASPAPSSSNDPGEFTSQFAPVLRPVAPAAPANQSAAPSSNDPGEFTRQFAPVLRPAPSSAAPVETTAEFSPPAPKSEQPMGEFTRQFQAPLRPVPSPPPPPRVQNPATTQSPQQEGEFTQLLKAQPTPTAPPSQTSAKSSDFDNYFQSPMSAPQGSTQQFRPMTPTPTPPMRTARDGEFTQVFGPRDVSAPPPPTPAASPGAGATQVFHAPPPMASPPVNLPMQGPPQGFPQGPSQSPPQGSEEWGRMFDAPASLTFGQSPAPTQGARMPEPAPSTRRRNRFPSPLLLIMAAVVLLLIGVIVYLVMRPR
jgi:hypothetical protein